MKFNYLGIFSELKIAYFNRKNPLNLFKGKFDSKYFGLLWVSRRFEV